MASASKYTLSTPQNILQDDSPLQDQWGAIDVATWGSENFVISLQNKQNFSTDRKFYYPVGKNKYMPVATTVPAREEFGMVAVIGTNVVIAHGLHVYLYTIGQNDWIKKHHLRNRPKCIFANESEIFVSSFECSKLVVFSSELVTQREVVLEGLDGKNYPVDLAVTSRNIYICTAESGKAKSFDKATGRSCCTFEYPREGMSSASSVTVVETVSLVLVLYQTGHILLFLAHPATCLLIIHSAMTHKIRALRENQLLAVDKSRVALYEMAGCIEFAKLIRTLAERLTDEQRDKLCEFYDISMLAPNRPLAILAYLGATCKVTPSDVSQLITAFTELGMVEHLCTVLKYKLQKIDIETIESLKEETTKATQALIEQKNETEKLNTQNTQLAKKLLDEQSSNIEHRLSLAKQQKEKEKEKSHNIELAKQLSVEKEHRMTEKQNISKVVGQMRGLLGALHSTFLQLEDPTQGSRFTENYPGKLTSEAKKKTRAAAVSELYRQTKGRTSSCSTDSGTGTMSSFSQQGNDFNLEVVSTLDFEGGELEIPGTGVRIDIPAGALKQREEIKIRIVPQQEINGEIRSFASNAFSVIELLPNNLKLGKPAAVTIPHCIQISKEAERRVAIFMSHHQEGCIPQWTESTEVEYRLEDDNCTIFTCSFCWIKVEVDDKIVEAKKLQIFATVPNISPPYNKSTFTIGYFVDLPGFEKEKDAIEKKPFLFKKDDGQPLVITLRKTVPKFWTQKMPSLNRQEISFSKIEQSEEEFCDFHLIKKDGCKGIPLCIFDVAQAENEMTLSVRSPVYYS